MKKRTLAGLVTTLFAPAFAFADDPPAAGGVSLFGSVGVGALHNDQDAKDPAKLNEYRDLSSGMLTLIDVKGRGANYWFDLFGENLGRDDEYVNVRGGSYDAFKWGVYTDALRHNFMFNGITPYAGAGTTNQTATFPNTNLANWNSLDIGYKRRDSGVMFEYQKADPWYARVEATRVTQTGTKPAASSQGTSPGNGFVELSVPTEYTTSTANFEVGYNTRAMQLSAVYTYSHFDNENDSVAWSNGYLAGVDRTYLAPDSHYDRLAMNATFRQLPWDTTIAARYTSDELKSSATLGTSYLSSGGVATPTNPSQAEFDGKIKNQTFSASASSAPTKGLDTRLYYSYRKRDDDSNVVTFSDGAVSPLFSYTKNNYGFDAYYRINRANRIGGGYDYLDTKREGRDDFDRTKDKRFFVEWKNSSLEDLAARLKYTRLERDSNFLHGSDGANSNDPNFLNRFVTAFDLSNVDQDQWKLTLDYTVMERLDLGFEGIIKNNKYKDNTLGRLKDDRREVYANASYAFTNGARFTLFGDSEQIKYDSQHRIIGDGSQAGAYDPATTPTSANYNWGGNIKDRNWAAGLAFDWPLTDKLSVKASAIYYRTDGMVDLSLEQGVPSSVTPPAPINNWDDSTRRSFNIKGQYAFSKTWSFTAGYAYETYDYHDSQYDGYQYIVTNSNAAQNAYLNGVYANPHYKTNLVYLLAAYHF